MPPEKPVQHGPLGDDEARAWTGEKRRKYVAPPSSHAPGTAQDSHVTDMDIIQGLPPRSYSGQQDKDGQEEEELFGPGVDISDDEIISYEKSLAPIHPPINPYCLLHPDEFWEVQERLARYRITYYKIAKPEFGCELKDPAEYSPDELYDEVYFERLEDISFEWYFHPEDSRICGLDDYQRLVISNIAHDTNDSQYLFWDDYRTRYHTYETDAVYVKYYGELSKKVKWIEGYLDLDRTSEEWKKMGARAWKQALKIATSFPQMTIDLVSFAFKDFIWELRMDAPLKELDLVYFEIWKRVTKQNRSFRETMEEVLGTDKFPLHKRKMEAELNGTPLSRMEFMLKAIVWDGDISENAGENEARNLFKKIVFKKLKKKNMADYALRKMEIADRMKLVLRVGLRSHDPEGRDGNAAVVPFHLKSGYLVRCPCKPPHVMGQLWDNLTKLRLFYLSSRDLDMTRDQFEIVDDAWLLKLEESHYCCSNVQSHVLTVDFFFFILFPNYVPLTAIMELFSIL